MPDGITDAITAIQTGVQQIPPVVMVVGMLFGPTLAWIGYRLYQSPKSKLPHVDGADLFWICRECRSANQPRDRHCYQCGLDAELETGPIAVVDHGAIVELEPEPPAAPARRRKPRKAPTPVIQEEAPLPLVAVGPGHADTDLSSPVPALAVDDLAELSWVCLRCRLRNVAADQRCQACGRDRATATSSLRIVGGVDVAEVASAGSLDDQPLAPAPPKVTKPRRVVASLPPEPSSTRRDAAS